MFFAILLFISCVNVMESTGNSVVIDVIEDARAGTVIIDNLEHRFPSFNTGEFKQHYIAIGNPSSPGINNLEIRHHRFDGSVQLVVKDGHSGPDREELCGNRESHSDSQTPFCDIPLIILHGKRHEPSYGKLTLRILDRNDNSPVFTKKEAVELRIPESIENFETVGSNVMRPSHMLHSNSKPNGVNPTSLELPKAHDIDLPENGVKTYRLTTVSGHEVDKSLFNLVVSTENEKIGNGQPVPSLRIVGLLDREKQDEYWFHLLAIDGGNPQRTGTQSVHLVVTDINDNIPKFRKPIYHFPTFVSSADLYGHIGSQEFLKISETQAPGTPIVTLVADDEDRDLNGQITYRLKEPLSNDQNAASFQWFSLENKNGSAILKVAKKMDADDRHGSTWFDLNREHSGRLVKLVVEAVDAGSPSLTGSIELFVLVENVNDNKPVISVQYTQPYQTESEVHSSIKTNIVGSMVENQNEQLTVAHLTVEDGDIIQSNAGTISNTQDVHCETNDTRFVLDKVSNLNYGDRTEGYGMNFADFGSPLLFYKMSSLKSIDREAKPWVFVKVICVDQVQVSYTLNAYQSIGKSIQPNRLTGSTTVTIKVLDINDNVPRFTQRNYRFSVFETPSILMNSIKDIFDDHSKVEVGRIKADDQDEGINSEVSYSLLSGETDAFKIDENTGILWRTGFIDREKISQIELIVEAKDHGNPTLSSTALIRVDILDVNDNPPYWIMSSSDDKENDIRRGGPEDGVYYFSLNEDAPIGSIVGTVKAVDTDGVAESEMIEQIMEKQSPSKMQKVSANNSPGTSSIVYQLENEGDGKIFSVNPRNGDIRLNQQLDREVRAHYEFRAFAIDGASTAAKSLPDSAHLTHKWKHQYTATATVIITVLDINDNPPIFETPLSGQEFHIEPGSSMATAGTTLFTAKAHDPDVGDNSIVRYSLDNNGYGLVEIDPTTGVCYFRETVQHALMNKLIASNEIPISGRSSNYLHSGNLISSENTITNRAHELHSFTLGLTIIARDLGSPHSLNNSRTVKLVWTSEAQLKALSSSTNELLDRGVFGASSGFLSDSRISIDKLIIPLIIGAILLILIIFLILFGIFRCRKQANKTSPSNKQIFINASYPSKFNKANSRISKDSINRINHNDADQSYWCLCINKHSGGQSKRRLSKQERIEEWKKSIQILDHTTNSNFTMNSKNDPNNSHNDYIVNNYGEFDTRNRENSEKLMTRIRNTQAEVSLKACLPDCVPSIVGGQSEQTWNRQDERINFKWNELQSFYPDGVRKPRLPNKSLTRTFSDDSMANIRQFDVGYTALCAYPNSPYNRSQFIPIQPDTNMDSYYTDDRIAKHPIFSPYLNRKSQIPSNRTNTFNASKLVPHSTVTMTLQQPSSLSNGVTILPPGSCFESTSYYSPLGINNTCHISNASVQPIISSYDIGRNLNEWSDKYEDFETDKELAILSKATEKSRHGWKPKLADAYAENSFV
uniref:Cadherin domain-containing protein n=1 Tax=Trichobilharzia regenti TaxID=157069 RepID=A0AA85KB40_TRIRE|nr:unnamed protein product [Trichobilharzia regenti]